MATYNWGASTFQVTVVSNAAIANSVVTFANIGLGSNVNTMVPYFSTAYAGLALKNVTGLMGSAGFTFDGANLVISNSLANTNVIISSSGDIYSTGNLTVTGNLSGNGAGLTGVTAGGLSNGTSNVAIPVTSDNVIVSVAGVPNVAVFTATGANIAGEVAASGNVTGNYILGNGALLTGVTTSSNSIFNGTSDVSVPALNGNVTTTIAGNPNVVVVAATGQYVTGEVSATGNITAGAGNFFIGNGSQLTGLTATVSNIVNGSSNVAIPTNSGNIEMSVAGSSNIAVVAPTGLYVTGEASVTGNVLASYFAGNGALLTGITTSSNAITNGTSNVAIDTAGGNITTAVAGNPNVVVTAATGLYVTGDISATGNIIGNLSEAIAANLSVTGNITSNSYILGNGFYLTGINSTVSNISNGLSNVAADTFSGDITVGIDGNANVVVISSIGLVANGILQATGNVIAGNVLGNYFIGDGSNLTNLSISTGNVTFANTTLSPDYTLGNITLETYDTANSLTYDLVFDATGNLSAPGNVIGNYVYANSGVFLNANVITANYVIPDGYNALSAGPITIQSGANVSGNGNWVVV